MTAVSSDAEELARKRYLESTPRRRFVRFWSEFIRRRPLGAFGLFLMIVMILSAIFADRIAPYDPTAIAFKDLLLPPSLEHLMGTDNFGRDVFSRLVYGSRTALLLGFTASIVGCTFGLALGIIGAYVGGLVDQHFGWRAVFQNVLFRQNDSVCPVNYLFSFNGASEG